MALLSAIAQLSCLLLHTPKSSQNQLPTNASQEIETPQGLLALRLDSLNLLSRQKVAIPPLSHSTDGLTVIQQFTFQSLSPTVYVLKLPNMRIMSWTHTWFKWWRWQIITVSNTVRLCPKPSINCSSAVNSQDPLQKIIWEIKLFVYLLYMLHIELGGYATPPEQHQYPHGTSI